MGVWLVRSGLRWDGRRAASLVLALLGGHAIDAMGWRLCSGFEANAVVRRADWRETQWKCVLEDMLKFADGLGDEGVYQSGTALLGFILCDCCRNVAEGCETSVCGLCQPCDFFTISVGGLGQLRCEKACEGVESLGDLGGWWR